MIIPPAPAAELQDAADEEHRPAIDVLRDAIEGYRREQRWRKTLSYGAAQAAKLGLSEPDVSQLIADYRQEKRRPTASE
jgi:hypothetical protein